MTAKRPALEIGVGLWTMQSTYVQPKPAGALYREAATEARRAEELGFDSVWLGEHHLSYDGFCPSLLPAAASILARTERIAVGTGILVLPFHTAQRVAEGCAALETLAPGRFRAGLGLGYREVEFAAAGLSVAQRVGLLDERLGALLAPPLRDRLGATQVWLGTGSVAGAARAARHGASVLVQPATGRRRLSEMYGTWQGQTPGAAAGQPARFGAMADVWVEDDERQLEWVTARVRETWRQYSNFWCDDPVTEQDRREMLVEQMSGTAVLGSPAKVTDHLAGLIELGVDSLVLRIRFDGLDGRVLDRCLERLSAEVLPQLRMGR